MLDTLGFHTHPDLDTQLAALRREIRALSSKVTGQHFHSYEDRHNTYGRLDNLQMRERVLVREVAMENQRLYRLADAVRIVGDAQLGFIAYVVFGPAALPIETLYEVRLIDRDGYTVPDSVRTNLPADRVERVKRLMLTVDAPRHARERGLRPSGYRVQVTPF